jgi:RimJ/RimL family protein N-acetyltransferase
VITFVYERDKEIADWTFRTFNIQPWPVVLAVGLLKDGNELVGAFLFQEYNGSNAELSYYGPGSVTLRVVREIARAALLLLNVNRLTIRTKRRNKHITRSIGKFGFSFEGVQKMFYGPNEDAIVFGLLRPDLIRIARLP